MFFVRPYSKRIARAISAAPKLYLFDILQLSPENEAARLENLVALHFLKACHYWTDTAQGDFQLCFVRDKQQREVDFLIVRDRKPWLMVECKTGDTSPAPALLHFKERLGVERAFQLVSKPGYDRMYAHLGVRVVAYETFLAGWV